jgi:hypothetical protein
MHFDGTAVDEEDAIDILPFLEDHFAFFKSEILTVNPYGGDPFGETSAAKKTAVKVAGGGLFLHTRKIEIPEERRLLNLLYYVNKYIT